MKIGVPGKGKMVLHLGFISTPISLCNATDPDVGITYNFKCIPKDPNTHLPYVEHYSGGLLVKKKHFESKEYVCQKKFS